MVLFPIGDETKVGLLHGLAQLNEAGIDCFSQLDENFSAIAISFLVDENKIMRLRTNPEGQTILLQRLFVQADLEHYGVDQIEILLPYG